MSHLISDKYVVIEPRSSRTKPFFPSHILDMVIEKVGMQGGKGLEDLFNQWPQFHVMLLGLLL